MKTLLATALWAAVLAGAASPTWAQTNNTGRALVVSNILQLSADTERCSAPVLKQFIVPYGGTVRVRWFLKKSGADGPVTAFVGSVINGCEPVITSSTTYEAHFCDLRVLAGDTVSVSGQGTFDPNTMLFSVPCLKNVRIYYNVINANGLGRVITN
jgi:hypothetical protein